MKTFSHPEIGKTVIVTVATNPQIRATSFFFIPEEVTYTGIVVKNESFDAVDSFCITSGLPSYFKFPVRNIMLRNVIGMKYQDGDAITKEEKSSTNGTKTFIEKSEKTGEEYIVSVTNGVWNCTCKGFMFRKNNCKHINKVKEKNNY
jgi:hypothetical protein